MFPVTKIECSDTGPEYNRGHRPRGRPDPARVPVRPATRRPARCNGRFSLFLRRGPTNRMRHVPCNVRGMKRTKASFRQISVASGLILLLIGGMATAAQRQDPESIRRLAADFAASDIQAGEGRLEIEAARLDPRLRLPACGVPLEAFAPPSRGSGNRRLIGVRCAAPSSWSIYVPVRVALYREVLVTRSALPRGHVITARDLERVSKDIYRLHQGFFTDPGRVVGMVTRAPLLAGRVLTDSQLEPRVVIERGARVLLVAKDGSIEVRMAGVALADGVAGERIRVRNLRSRRVVQGKVIDARTVRVGL
ncbi:MAG: flagella basal body P-ring formation protein FlgA [Gammaproteobacteria bacterium]|nr:MAG: flagella basal body P-ring formation protein FlgA [Gammaproteobacteria bacterium]